MSTDQNAKPGSLQPDVRRRRLRHSDAVKAELNVWHLNHAEKTMVLVFCACVGLRMKGDDMTNYLKPPNDRSETPPTEI